MIFLNIIFCNEKQSEFITNNINKIIAKRLEHVNESGYVKLSADSNFDIQKLEFKSKKSLNEAEFQKISIFDSLVNAVPVGKLYFEVKWKKTNTIVKLYCDYQIDKGLQAEPIIAYETLKGMVNEEKRGLRLYSITEYDQLLNALNGVKNDHPFGREKAIVLAGLRQTQIVAIKLMAMELDEEYSRNEHDSAYSAELIAWLDESEKLMNDIDPEFDTDDEEF